MDWRDMAGNAPTEQKIRIIEEWVPGKQISLAHIIAHPDAALLTHFGFSENAVGNAIGIVTVTPSEASLIVADIAIKTSGVHLEFVGKENGTVLVTGTVSQVESALRALIEYTEKKLGFTVCEVTQN